MRISKGVLETRTFSSSIIMSAEVLNLPQKIFYSSTLGRFAIAKLYQFWSHARIIGPSPAYSTHSSAEAAHPISAPPITLQGLILIYQWLPDMEDLYLKSKITILSIVGKSWSSTRDNPTGDGHPREVLEGFVKDGGRVLMLPTSL